MYSPPDHFEVLTRFAEALTKLQESERAVLLIYFDKLTNPSMTLKSHTVDILA